MPVREKSDNRASTDTVETNGFRRRNFLQFLAGAFAAAALPEIEMGCGSPSTEVVVESGTAISFSSVPITWVTRKQDGLSLGFQLVNLVADTSHNIALAPGAAAGSAYVAITFPPQHVIEDALLQPASPPGAAPAYPLNARASGTSRIVFGVPASYGTAVDAGGIGTFPYTLQGVLELCSVSQPVVAPNAGAATPAAKIALHVADEGEYGYEGLSQARIDRAIARVDEKAATRVRRRAVRATRILNSQLAPVLTTGSTGGTGIPVMPTSAQTSIELPFRLLISPNAQTGWSFMSAPVVSPNVQGQSADASRAELWHARMAPLNAAGLPDLLLGGLSVRALYTRDWDVYGQTTTYGVYHGSGATPGNGNLPESGSPYQNDPVDYMNPSAPNREALVLQSGNMAGATLAPLNVNRLVLSPAGGTLDAWADWTNAPSVRALSYAALEFWKQKTVLGRDEYVESVNAVTVQPGGFPAVLSIINKRCDNPATGTVGVLYSTTYLTITQPLVSFVGAPNASDYNTFPFVALEITQTKIATNATAGATTFVNDPNGNPVTLGMIGTDWKGNSIKFTTRIAISPPGAAAAASVVGLWNGSGAGQSYQLDGQRIAFAPPADGNGASTSSYSADSTSFETTSFGITLKSPTASVIASPTPAQLVPMAKSIVLAVEAVRHLQSSPAGGTPAATDTYDYDLVCYGPHGFGTAPNASGVVTSSTNPNEIFLTLSRGISLPPGTKTPPSNGNGPLPTAGPGPGINFTTTPAQSGGLAAPAVSANALSRSAGVMSGAVAAAGTTSSTSALYSGGLNPGDFLNGFDPKLFGFVELGAIIPQLSGIASKFMPKAITKELSNAEAFLEEAMSLYDLVINLAGSGDVGGQASLLTTIETQVKDDIATYTALAAGTVPAGGAIAGGTTFAAGAPLTKAQIQAATAMASAATSALTTIQGYASSLTTIASDATALYQNITGLDFDVLLATSLPTFMTALDGFVAELTALGANPNPQSAAGVVMSYFGPVLKPVQTALTGINSYLGNGYAQLQTDLAALSQGLDLAKNMSVEFKWTPIITGLEAGGFVAFIPSSNQAFSLDIQVNATATNGNPAGVDITIRLDSFAIAFGGTLPAPSGPAWLGGAAAPVACGYKQVLQNADVSLVFDHMQVQMLAGQKPDVDVVFDNIYFGGDLAFIESIKNLIPLDAFSDPPFVNVTTSGITAGFSLGLPNIAVGMFSMQNMNISAALTIPFISTGNSGVTFEFDFCSIDNPFVVTVSMLGGGGFFSMWMDMNGLEGVAFGIQVEAQLAVDFVIASGSISIEVGIFLVYWNPSDMPSITVDPVTNQAPSPGWLIGGYLRLRGELDVCGIITISVELYLQITYSPTTGKCIGSGFISVDVSLFFFSINAEVAFSRQFSGSNGDPTFAQMLSAGGVDPMIDPTLKSTATSATWDPFEQYCMAFV